MEIDLGKVPFTMDFHPSDNLVTAGLITGDLHLYRFNADSSPQRLLEIHAHSESCRAARFINDGHAIITGSSDRSILATDLETGSPIARLENAHEDAIFSLINLTESTVATGDDQGCVKVWDTRQRSCCNSFNVHDDYVSDMTFASDSMKLLSTSGDGTLSVCNLRTNKIQSQSEFSEEELLSVVIMKQIDLAKCIAYFRHEIGMGIDCLNPSHIPMEHSSLGGGDSKKQSLIRLCSCYLPPHILLFSIVNGRKVICGTQNGTLLLYSWGFFKDCSDRFTALSPNSIDSLLKLDEDRVITGSENGLISLIGILPNRVIQPLAEHSEYPIECLGLYVNVEFLLAFSHDRKYLGSISHDQLLKMWDLDDLLQNSGNAQNDQAPVSDSDSDTMDMDAKPPKSRKGAKRKNEHANDATSSFFADL
ncbi:hypothetical protein POTOM_054111 [Populus tomentosa]|uniref:WD repeat-containing protein 55 n=1 Tax=Populus tomentosa TaxID=118781 RepID=A0A8X8C6S0_POPTO|nr:hypothetical protein POTOM_054111 [Populus tomentosa]